MIKNQEEEIDHFDDGGLYTGETVLHILIAKRDKEMIEKVLKRGADLGARAIGAFFKPRSLPRAYGDDGIPVRPYAAHSPPSSHGLAWPVGCRPGLASAPWDHSFCTDTIRLVCRGYSSKSVLQRVSEFFQA
jgi:hypothetical protein